MDRRVTEAAAAMRREAEAHDAAMRTAIVARDAALLAAMELRAAGLRRSLNLSAEEEAILAGAGAALVQAAVREQRPEIASWLRDHLPIRRNSIEGGA